MIWLRQEQLTMDLRSTHPHDQTATAEVKHTRFDQIEHLFGAKATSATHKHTNTGKETSEVPNGDREDLTTTKTQTHKHGSERTAAQLQNSSNN